MEWSNKLWSRGIWCDSESVQFSHSPPRLVHCLKRRQLTLTAFLLSKQANTVNGPDVVCVGWEYKSVTIEGWGLVTWELSTLSLLSTRVIPYLVSITSYRLWGYVRQKPLQGTLLGLKIYIYSVNYEGESSTFIQERRFILPSLATSLETPTLWLQLGMQQNLWARFFVQFWGFQRQHLVVEWDIEQEFY